MYPEISIKSHPSCQSAFEQVPSIRIHYLCRFLSFFHLCRLCEICGETAKNITGIGDNGFMEEWNERRYTVGNSNSSDRGGGCWRGQPFCNFLMACLVIAFVLPWFFRVNMF